MPLRRKILWIIISLAAIVLVPLIALIIKYKGIPDDFFIYPPLAAIGTKSEPAMAFNICVFIIFGLVAILLIYPRAYCFIFPKHFCFKKVKAEPVAVKKVKFPIWFWIGLFSWVATTVLLWGKFSQPRWIIEWALLPLWWGFILFIDGIVYKRSGGESLVNDEPAELISMAVISISGWFLFDYLNFYINLNWYYPDAGLLKHDYFLLYALFGSACFIPMAFEWYYLLRTFNFLNRCYKYGPVCKFPGWLRIGLIIASFVCLGLAPFFPDHLFWVVWLGPLIILSIVIDFLGIWTPFASIKERGDWTALLVIAPAFLIQGFILECWNYFSAFHLPDGSIKTYNPAYWIYTIPWIIKIRIFEMPILGYLGYIPFSIFCWIWWVTLSYLMNVKTNYSLHEDYK
jgi:hypothetical protein